MIKNILFDFDGVILESMKVRDFGFREIFKEYDEKLVEKLVEYNNINGGLSRFVKIKYFFEELLKENITEEEIRKYADKFSIVMKKELTKKQYEIKDSIDFINENSKNYKMHIVSGSEEKELNFLCEAHNLNKNFITIEGSPTPKNELVKNILEKYFYKKEETILIGDSINDYVASKINNIEFYGYNNINLKAKSNIYINKFEKIRI